MGIITTADLAWSAHVSKIRANARKLVGMLYGLFYQDPDSSILLQFYVSNIRPHLKYACQAWYPYRYARICSEVCLKSLS